MSLLTVLNISDIPFLRALSLPVTIAGTDPKSSERVDDLANLLSTIPSSRPLSELEFSFIIRASAYKTYKDAIEALLAQNWDRLGPEFVRLATNRPLNVVLRPMWSGVMTNETWEEIRERFTERMKFISDTPGISLRIEVGIFCM